MPSSSQPPPAEPFEESRRLTGFNVYFSGTGAALETAGGLLVENAALARWRVNIEAARARLDWPDGPIVARVHRSGASLAFQAPQDQLYTATELNEWAWYDALGLIATAEAVGDTADDPPPRQHAATWPREQALQQLQALAADEANPALSALQRAADQHGVVLLADDDMVSLGMGVHSQAWPVDALPAVDDVPWATLRAIPTALVTGSNGKTTTVRLLAAMTRAQGWATSHSCTDGVFFDGQALEAGDFSGPTGARTALRQPLAEAAILETARGGMLRRGLALGRADAAVVTNISVDHFGEYGIHDLDDLAGVKLTVARAVADAGLLVLNADDPVLQRQAPAFAGQRLAWFALDGAHPRLQAHRTEGGTTVGVDDGHLWLHVEGVAHDLGAVADMPLTLGGQAGYNIANAAAAAATASGLGVTPPVIARVLRRFGDARQDNPGRLQRWRFAAMEVVVDYAHNPDGLRGLLQAVGADRRDGRLGIVVGHAGNREEADLRAVAATAAAFAPERVLLKDVESYLRGREAGEVARIMRDELLQRGLAAGAIGHCPDEVDASRSLLAWGRDGDLLVLPTFDQAARARVEWMLERMLGDNWRPGDPLPDLPPPDGAVPDE
jgi:UDP-N-acetylmuramyl tripeptide synthase